MKSCIHIKGRHGAAFFFRLEANCRSLPAASLVFTLHRSRKNPLPFALSLPNGHDCKVLPPTARNASHPS